MKLILCTECTDIVRLIQEKRTCRCGLSSGEYTDRLNAVYEGPCIPLGINNQSLVRAIINQPDLGERFDAFVIPKVCPTMKKL